MREQNKILKNKLFEVECIDLLDRRYPRSVASLWHHPPRVLYSKYVNKYRRLNLSCMGKLKRDQTSLTMTKNCDFILSQYQQKDAYNQIERKQLRRSEKLFMASR